MASFSTQDLPRRIVERRVAAGLPAYRLAAEVGISPAYMSMIERGQRIPDPEVAARIAEALKDDPEVYRRWAREARLGDRIEEDELQRPGAYLAEPVMMRTPVTEEMEEALEADLKSAGAMVFEDAQPTSAAPSSGWKAFLTRRSDDSVQETPPPPTMPASSSEPRRRPRPDRFRLTDDGFLERDCPWKEKYGWRPVQRPEDMDFLDERGARIRFRLIRDGEVRFLLEMSADEWREALGDYFDGPTWRRNGYVVAITKRRAGEYTEEFQERWGRYVRGV